VEHPAGATRPASPRPRPRLEDAVIEVDDQDAAQHPCFGRRLRRLAASLSESARLGVECDEDVAKSAHGRDNSAAMMDSCPHPLSPASPPAFRRARPAPPRLLGSSIRSCPRG
jgi:hypothetical protein